MASTTDSISLELDTDEGLSMGNHEDVPFSIGLLLDATEKEQKNLILIEDCMRDLESALRARRRSINEQRELLRDLAESLNTNNRGN
jgi:hypothetical protein